MFLQTSSPSTRFHVIWCTWQAEAQLANLKQDYDRYVSENEEKSQKLNASMEKLTQEKTSLANALDEEKRYDSNIFTIVE